MRRSCPKVAQKGEMGRQHRMYESLIRRKRRVRYIRRTIIILLHYFYFRQQKFGRKYWNFKYLAIKLLYNKNPIYFILFLTITTI